MKNANGDSGRLVANPLPPSCQGDSTPGRELAKGFRRRLRAVVLISAQAILGGVFLYAGVVKMRDPLAFADSVATFRILPVILINLFALTLPPVEILTGLVLVGTVVGFPTPQPSPPSTIHHPPSTRPWGNRFRRVGALSVMILCSVFIFALASALARGIAVDCNCFTLSPPFPGWLHPQQSDSATIGSGNPSVLKTWLGLPPAGVALGRDLILLAVAVVLYRQCRALERQAEPELWPQKCTKGAREASASRTRLSAHALWLAALVAGANGGMAEPTNAVMATGKDAAPSPAALQQDIGVETQWRVGLDPELYPLFLVYLSNRTKAPVEWSRVLLNPPSQGDLARDGTDVTQGLTNDVMYTQFYPAAQFQQGGSGATVELQVGMAEPPVTNLTLIVETKAGARVSVPIPAFAPPACRLTGVAFSADYGRIFLSYEAKDAGQPVSLTVNGAECAKTMQVLERPHDEEPGLIRAELPQPTASGRPVHVRLQAGDQIAQTILRAYHGLSIDSFGVGTDAKDAALRRDLCLSDRPYVMIGADPACEDLLAGSFLGRSMAHLLGERAKTYASAPDRLSYHYQCTAACNATFSLYGYVTDLLVCNPYRLQWSAAKRFIEEEENFFRSAWESAQPRPWGWFPETFVKTPNARWLEASELRLEALAAISLGAKAVSYYTYGSAEDWSGFEKSPPLLAEIKRLNADFKKLDPWLASALPISQETAGSARKGLRVSALWSGETDRGQDHPGKGDALVVVARNLDYATDRDENDFGRKSRFKAKPKEKVQISLHKPEWLNPTKAVDALTGQAVSCRVENQSIRLDLETVELGKIVVIQ